MTSRRPVDVRRARSGCRARGCSTRPTSSSTSCTPHADAHGHVDGLDTPVGPGSTITDVAIVNSHQGPDRRSCSAQRDAMPPVITRASEVGEERSRALFDQAYRRACTADRSRHRPVTRRWVTRRSLRALRRAGDGPRARRADRRAKEEHRPHDPILKHRTDARGGCRRRRARGGVLGHVPGSAAPPGPPPASSTSSASPTRSRATAGARR